MNGKEEAKYESDIQSVNVRARKEEEWKEV